MILRILGVLAFFLLLAILLQAIMGGGGSAERDARGTYRPRTRWRDWFFGRGDRTAQSGLVHIVKRAELAGVRDAFSSASIDPDRPLYRCASCQGFYHDASVTALARENHHRCAVCGGTDIGPVHVVD
ncbi:MAG: hypothetical protein ACKVQT_04990 [Burkholderiales bacterium]